MLVLLCQAHRYVGKNKNMHMCHVIHELATYANQGKYVHMQQASGVYISSVLVYMYSIYRDTYSSGKFVSNNLPTLIHPVSNAPKAKASPRTRG